MRVFVAGATGAIGTLLVPQLVSAGHQVAGMTRRESKAAELRQLGAEPIICDVFDADALSAAIAAFGPDAVMHQLTDLPSDPRQIPANAAANSRVRREGTRNLVVAALAAGTSRFLAQSVAFELAGDGAAAVRDHERAVLDVGGVVLRYGHFWGPGTYYEDAPGPAPTVHVAHAARRTVELIDGSRGVITIIDPD